MSLQPALRRRILATAVLALAAGASSCSTSSDSTAIEGSQSHAPPASTVVTKTVFASGEPASAKGQELYLYQVVIPVGAEIAAHTHPGMQMAHIEAGTLTYEVLDGTAIIIRDAGTPDEKREEATDRTVTLETGDGVIEEPGMVHQASNHGDVPVQIVLSSLFPQGAEMSSPAPVPVAP